MTQDLDKRPSKQLSELASIRAGYQTRTGIKPVAEGSHFLVQLRDFSPDRATMNTAGLVRVSAGQVGEGQDMREGDVLFLAKGAKNFAHVPVSLPGPSLAASYFFILRPESGVLPEYLAWFLNLESTRRYLAKRAGSGIHMPVVRRDVLEELEIPTPDRKTQEAVVELDRLSKQQQSLLFKLADAKRTFSTEACRRLSTSKPATPNSHE